MNGGNGLILPSQKNQVLLALEAYGFTAEEFIWEDHHSEMTTYTTVSKLTHKSSIGYFIFDFFKGQHYCSFSPGEDKQIDSFFSQIWVVQMSYFYCWIKYLRREIEAPDLWGTIRNEKGFLHNSFDTENNEPFSREERVKIESSLNEIKEFIKVTHETQTKDILFLESRIEYLITSSERLGKKDWKVMAIGMFFDIIVQSCPTSESAGDVMRFISTSLKWLYVESIKLIQ